MKVKKEYFKAMEYTLKSLNLYYIGISEAEETAISNIEKREKLLKQLKYIKLKNGEIERQSIQ